MTRNEPPDADPVLYDRDFFTWTQRQAAAVRALSGGAALDVEHVAAEIEDLGKRDLREVRSFLARLIEHLIKLDSCPDARDRAHWISEAGHFQGSAHDAYSPGMRQSLDIAPIWRRGSGIAFLALEQMGVASAAPEHPPFTLDQLLSSEFQIMDALAVLERTRQAPGGSS